MFETNNKVAFSTKNNNCCRICTNRYESGQSIHEYIVYIDKRPVEMMEYCLQQPVDTSSHFPDYICAECTPNLIETYKFITLCKKSEEYFKAIYQNWNDASTIVEEDIKVEPLIIIPECSGPMISDDVPIKAESVIDDDEITAPENVVVFVEPLAALTCEMDGINAVENVNINHNNDPSAIKDNSVINKGNSSSENKKKKLKCSICDQFNFSSMSDLIEHEKLHVKSYECFICKYLFQRFVDLCWHMRNHSTGEKSTQSSDSIQKPKDMKGRDHPWMNIIHGKDGIKRFICKLCKDGKEFMKKSCIYQHRFKVHKEGRFKCMTCSKMCVSKATLAAHMRSHLPAESLQCPACDRIVSGKYRLRIHMQKCAPHLVVEEKTFKCTICRRKYDDEQKYERHKRKHIFLQCDHCPERFKTKDILEDHLLMAHADELSNFSCGTCPEVFPLMSLLKLHAPQCRKQMEYKHLCSECGKFFRTPSSLQAHRLVVHSSDRNFACNHCPNTYKTKACLKSHLLQVHVKEPNYFCDLCGASYANRGSLRIHRMKHSDNKQFQCQNESCNARFYTNYKLQVHTRIHTGERPFKCDHCLRAFSQKGDMTKHMLIHLGPTPHKCTECDASFRLATELRKHSYLHFKPPEN